MCDRILLFSSNPGRILDEVRVPLPHPRNRLDPTFRKIVDSVYARMTARHTDAGAPRSGLFPGLGLGMVLPNVSTNLLSGLLENLAQEPYGGRGHLPSLATKLQMEAKALLPIAEVLQLLRFVEISEGEIVLTEAGRRFAAMGPAQRQELFGDHLITYVPLAAHIRRVLDERFERGAPLSRFREELEDYMTPDDAETTLKTVIGWGRYGEIFSYWEDAAALRMAVPMPTS